MPQNEQTELMLSLASNSPAEVDFIVNYEIAIKDRITENSMEHDAIINEYCAWLRENRPGAQLITGASTQYIYGEDETPSTTAIYNWATDMVYDVYNTALTIDTTGYTQLRHKSLLVMGTERMPYPKLVNRIFGSKIIELGGISAAFATDPEPRIFNSPLGVRSGTLICWEALFGYYCSEMVRAGAEVLFVISNDGWWGETRGHKQLFLYSRLRAVENRRSVGRSSNTGISGFINQRGDVINKIGWDKRSAISGELGLNGDLTFYARHGDYLAHTACGIAPLCIFLYLGSRFNIRRRVRKR